MMNTVNLFCTQPDLRLILPTVIGNVDYQCLRQTFERIDELLEQSGLETQCIAQSVKRWLAAVEDPAHPPSPAEQVKYQERCRRALRCNIARIMLQEGFRGFSERLADSPLLQWFCGADRLDVVQVPSKSELHRFAELWPEAEVRALVDQLLQSAAVAPVPMGLADPLDLDRYFLDTTCVKANIHYPVDWVLLRDGTRTLMKGVILIRGHGLKNRMEAPEAFLREMNRLCIQMTHTRRKPDAKKERKRVLRLMKRMVKTVKAHAQKHRDLLDQAWDQTDWTRPQADQVIRRLDAVLALLPQAEKQAHERIIGERSVANDEKLISLYETDTNVIVRGKAGAEVEFGNTLRLGETPQGLIVDWQLFQDSAPSDSAQLQESVERVQRTLQRKIKGVGADRGFDSAANRDWLKEKRIFNGICPRSPRDLKARLRQRKFVAMQQRRSQTEGRIGIVKNQFLGRPLRVKGFAHREMAVAWGVLTHNLWVLARLPQAAAELLQEAA
jgi:IS5 family transposase